jgi:hypothetical protein
LCALYFKGCKCTVAGGVTKVEKGTLVIMEGEMVRNLYRLIGYAFSGGAVKKTSNNRGENLWFRWS